MAVVTVWAATLTITIPTAEVPRVAEAYGARGGFGRPANINEVAVMVRGDIMAATQSYERNRSAAQYQPTPVDIQPTPTATATATATPTGTPTATPTP